MASFVTICVIHITHVVRIDMNVQTGFLILHEVIVSPEITPTSSNHSGSMRATQRANTRCVSTNSPAITHLAPFLANTELDAMRELDAARTQILVALYAFHADVAEQTTQQGLMYLVVARGLLVPLHTHLGDLSVQLLVQSRHSRNRKGEKKLLRHSSVIKRFDFLCASACSYHAQILM